MATCKELVDVLRVRYGGATLDERIKILNEFVALTGYYRKHAIRVLRDEVKEPGGARQARNRLYDEAVRQALTIAYFGEGDRRFRERDRFERPMLSCVG